MYCSFESLHSLKNIMHAFHVRQWECRDRWDLAAICLALDVYPAREHAKEKPGPDRDQGGECREVHDVSGR